MKRNWDNTIYLSNICIFISLECIFLQNSGFCLYRLVQTIFICLNVVHWEHSPQSCSGKTEVNTNKDYWCSWGNFCQVYWVCRIVSLQKDNNKPSLLVLLKILSGLKCFKVRLSLGKLVFLAKVLWLLFYMPYMEISSTSISHMVKLVFSREWFRLE